MAHVWPSIHVNHNGLQKAKWLRKKCKKILCQNSPHVIASLHHTIYREPLKETSYSITMIIYNVKNLIIFSPRKYNFLATNTNRERQKLGRKPTAFFVFLSPSCYRAAAVAAETRNFTVPFPKIYFSPKITQFCFGIFGPFESKKKKSRIFFVCRSILKDHSVSLPGHFKGRNSLYDIGKGCPRHFSTF